MRQLALDIGLAAAPSFDSFIALGNEAAVQALLSLEPGGAPVYVWGPSGCGKTHLLQALQARAGRAQQGVAWLDASSTGPLGLPEDTQWLLMDQAEVWSPQQHPTALRPLVTSRRPCGSGVVAAGVFDEKNHTCRRVGMGNQTWCPRRANSIALLRASRRSRKPWARNCDSVLAHYAIGGATWCHRYVAVRCRRLRMCCGRKRKC